MTTGPRPGSSWDSITLPEAGASGLAASSSSSVTSRMFSSRLSRPWWVFAETSQKIVSPPHSSGVMPSWVSSVRTRSGLAPSLSILLTAISIGTSAARAWSIASLVCGMTPSSAATTTTTTSVTLAPRARIAVKAAWPGVSRKVIVLLVVVDLVGADVLGDAAGLARGDLGLADRVQQRGLAVVDVAHDRDHRRAVDEVLVGVGELRFLGLLVGGGDDFDLAVVLVGDRPDRLIGERLGERRHLAHHHQFFDHLGRGQADRLGQLTHGGAGVDLGRLGLDRGLRTHRRLLQQRPAATATAAARRALRRRAAHLVAAGGLRVDHDAAFFARGAAATADRPRRDRRDARVWSSRPVFRRVR